MQVIADTGELESFCQKLREQPFVAVDTEFMREKTYWPVLCLIQAAADGIEAIIDPMAEGIDLQPFLDIMADPKIVKVFHAARQDIEIFVHLQNDTPKPIFDTQIAAMVCGFGDQIGYEPLMRNLLGAQIDKGSRFTDWSRRPLSDQQLSYALSDVTHLRDAYPILKKRLEETDRLSWVEDEMSRLVDPALYITDPSQAWRRLKLRGVRQADVGPLMKLAEWREMEAQKRNLPRARIFKDDAILELARMKPKSVDELGRARTVPNGFERSRQGAGVLAAVKEGRNVPREMAPRVERNQNRAPAPADVLELLKVVLKRQCEEFEVAQKLIASSSDLEMLALDPNADIPATKGWRRKVFGETAMSVMKGDLALCLHDKRIELVKVR